MLNTAQTHTSSPTPKHNLVNSTKPLLKNLGAVLGDRLCHTPNSTSGRSDNTGEKYLMSTKSRSSASLEPYRRHCSFVNQAGLSATNIHEKENTFLNYPTRYGNHLQECTELEENSLDDEKSYYEGSNLNSIYHQKDSKDSQDIFLKEDSFYMRFSNIKLKTKTLPTFQDVDEDESGEKIPEPTRPVKVSPLDLKQIQQKKPEILHKKADSKAFVPVQVPGKKTPILPYQAVNMQLNKAENYLNLAKRANNCRAAANNKENNKENNNANIQPRASMNFYNKGLKRCLTANQEAINILPTVTGPHTTKASSSNVPLQNLRGLFGGNYNKEHQRGNKTLFIGNKDPLKTEERPAPQFRATFLIPSNTPEPCNGAQVQNKKREDPSSDQTPQEKPQSKKVILNSFPLELGNDTNYSNAKLKAHKLDIVPSLVQSKPSIIQPLTLRDLKFDKVLGQGAYAIVKLAFNKYSGKHVAVKTYEKSKLRDPAKMRNVKREISLLKDLDHPHIIKLHTSIETPKQIHLVMEYVGNISLQSYLKSKTIKRLEEGEAKKIFRQLCAGISYCHRRNVVHRDIKLENILLDDDHNVKIIDFGFSICIPSDKTLAIFCGTPSYMSPEIVSKIQYKGGPSDVWALGVVLYALLCGRFPFRGLDEKDLFSKIKMGRYEVPLHVSSGARELLQRIFCIKPEERPSVDEVRGNGRPMAASMRLN